MRSVLFCGVLGIAATVGCLATPTAGSIGAVLSHDRVSGELTVHEAPVGLAGDNAGLIEGDRIKMIDGVLVDELDGERIRKLLRGAIGSTVTLTVVRGDEVVHIAIERQSLGAGAQVAERHERIE